jgi:hypothetical protein
MVRVGLATATGLAPYMPALVAGASLILSMLQHAQQPMMVIMKL